MPPLAGVRADRQVALGDHLAPVEPLQDGQRGRRPRRCASRGRGAGCTCRRGRSGSGARGRVGVERQGRTASSSASSAGGSAAGGVDGQGALDVQPRLDRPGPAGLGAVEGQPVDPARLAVERERPVAGDRPLAAEHRPPDLARRAGPGPTSSSTASSGRLQRVGGQGVVAAQAPRGLVADRPAVARRATGCVGSRAASASGSPGPWTSSSSDRVSGPPGLETTTSPVAALGDQQRDLGPEHRGRRPDLAVDRRGRLDHPPGRPGAPPARVDRRRPARRTRAASRPSRPAASAASPVPRPAPEPAGTTPRPSASTTTRVVSPTRVTSRNETGASAPAPNPRSARPIAQPSRMAIPSSSPP